MSLYIMYNCNVKGPTGTNYIFVYVSLYMYMHTIKTIPMWRHYITLNESYGLV